MSKPWPNETGEIYISSRAIAAALAGVSGSDWLSGLSETRARMSFSASRIADINTYISKRGGIRSRRA
jgi:hypothetical protein